MTAVALDSPVLKPLPSPIGSDELPAPPPPEKHDFDATSKPALDSSRSHSPPPMLDLLPPLGKSEPGTSFLRPLDRN